ncbi:unnamed protein product [Mucor hiemalis]
MPFCRCGELCNTDKCKKCGLEVQMSEKSARRHSVIDRWQSSRYLGSVMGLDELSSEEQESRLACSPLSKRATSPILKRISRPFNGLLDSRKVTPSKTMGALSTPASRRYSTTAAETGCGECGKKLTGKTVRLPDTQVRYHWKCLNCKGCSLPFEDTSFFIDSSNRVFHPECAPPAPITEKCNRCSQTISDSYISCNSTVFHPRCFRCTGCQKILHPASIYTDMNGSFCQQCTSEKLVDDKEILAKHMKIVPQPHVIPMVSPANGLDVSELAQSMTKCSMSPSVERTMSSPSSRSRLPELPQEKLDESVIKPSSLMSSRGRPLPRFGVVRDCPGCSQRIVSVHEEIPGPKAARWHKKCLACKGCSKILDSGATVHEEEGTGNLKPWCTTCLLKKKKTNSFTQKWSPASTLTSLSTNTTIV